MARRHSVILSYSVICFVVGPASSWHAPRGPSVNLLKPNSMARRPAHGRNAAGSVPNITSRAMALPPTGRSSSDALPRLPRHRPPWPPQRVRPGWHPTQRVAPLCSEPPSGVSTHDWQRRQTARQAMTRQPGTAGCTRKNHASSLAGRHSRDRDLGPRADTSLSPPADAAQHPSPAVQLAVSAVRWKTSDKAASEKLTPGCSGRPPARRSVRSRGPDGPPGRC